MPTKEDIARVATLVINLENKVDNIEEFLEEKVESVGQAPTLKRDVTKVKQRSSHIRNEGRSNFRIARKAKCSTSETTRTCKGRSKTCE